MTDDEHRAAHRARLDQSTTDILATLDRIAAGMDDLDEADAVQRLLLRMLRMPVTRQTLAAAVAALAISARRNRPRTGGPDVVG